jgi:hypothetical protein
LTRPFVLVSSSLHHCSDNTLMGWAGGIKPAYLSFMTGCSAEKTGADRYRANKSTAATILQILIAEVLITIPPLSCSVFLNTVNRSIAWLKAFGLTACFLEL